MLKQKENKMTELKNIEEYENINKDKLTIIDFYATWCQPCKMLSPILEDVSKESSDVDIIKINTEEFPQLASKYGVMSVPTVIYMKGGEILKSSHGVTPKAAILAEIDSMK